MKLCYSALLCFALLTSTAFGQVNNDMFDLQSIGKSNGGLPEGGNALCDELDALAVGPLNDQIGASGLDFGAVASVNVVDAGGGDLETSDINVAGDDTFILQIFVDVVPAGIAPRADDGLTVSFDYSLSDLNTDRFYAPQAANEGIIFTRLGDPDGDGDWDVLETDGMGGGVFFDTGVAIALDGNIEFVINDLAMDVNVNGTMIYTGGIIGSNGDIGLTPGETLTSIVTQTVNNADGLGSEENLDNFAINTSPCGGGCAFAIGDINEDGAVDLLDVQPFVAVLTGGSPAVCQADINGDGVIDLLDVQPFVELLTG